jgi:hypothetical protein
MVKRFTSDIAAAPGWVSGSRTDGGVGFLEELGTTDGLNVTS